MVYQNQKLVRDPSLEQTLNGRYGVVVDGANLPSGIIEDVRGFSLRPSYSAKELRRIQQLAKKNADRESRSSSVRIFQHRGLGILDEPMDMIIITQQHFQIRML